MFSSLIFPQNAKYTLAQALDVANSWFYQQFKVDVYANSRSTFFEESTSYNVFRKSELVVPPSFEIFKNLNLMSYGIAAIAVFKNFFSPINAVINLAIFGGIIPYLYNTMIKNDLFFDQKNLLQAALININQVKNHKNDEYSAEEVVKLINSLKASGAYSKEANKIIYNDFIEHKLTLDTPTLADDYNDNLILGFFQNPYAVIDDGL
jgi:hypothetical protein